MLLVRVQGWNVPIREEAIMSVWRVHLTVVSGVRGFNQDNLDFAPLNAGMYETEREATNVALAAIGTGRILPSRNPTARRVGMVVAAYCEEVP